MKLYGFKSFAIRPGWPNKLWPCFCCCCAAAYRQAREARKRNRKCARRLAKQEIQSRYET